MVACFATGCLSRSNELTKKDGVTFHRFPDKHKESERFRIWSTKLGRHMWEPTKFSRVCSKHFEESCFYKTSKRVRLRNDTVPMIYNSSYGLQKNTDQNNFETKLDTTKPKIDLIKDNWIKSSPLLRTTPSKYRRNAPFANENTSSNSDIALRNSCSCNSTNKIVSTITETDVEQETLDFQSIYTSYAMSANVSLVNSEHSYSLSPLPKKIINRNYYLLDKIDLATKKKKSLCQKVRILKSKVNRLEKEIKLYKEKWRSISFIDNYNNLRDGMAKELIKNILNTSRNTNNVKNKYAQDILTFAKTLYFISQEAYEYVKTVLNNTLPESQKARLLNSKADLDPRFLKSISISREKINKQNKKSNLSEDKNKKYSNPISIDISNLNPKPLIKSSNALSEQTNSKKKNTQTNFVSNDDSNKIKNNKKLINNYKPRQSNCGIKRKQVLLRCAQNSKRRAISNSNKDMRNTTHSENMQFNKTVPVILTENELQLTSNEIVTDHKSNIKVNTEDESSWILNTNLKNDSKWYVSEVISDHESNLIHDQVCNQNEFIPINSGVSTNLVSSDTINSSILNIEQQESN